MKQRDLVKRLEKAGFEFARHGGGQGATKNKFQDIGNLMKDWQKQY